MLLATWSSFQRSYKLIYRFLENFCIDLFQLKNFVHTLQVQIFLFFAAHYMMIAFFFYTFKLVYFPWPYLKNYLLCPLFFALKFIFPLVFRPMRFFYFPITCVLLPLLSSSSPSLLRSVNIRDAKENSECEFDSECDCSPTRFDVNRQSLSKYNSNAHIDSAFIENPFHETNLTRHSKAAKKSGNATQSQRIQTTIPFFPYSLIQANYDRDTPLSLGFSSTLYPESLKAKFLDHVGFDEKIYILVPHSCKEENILAMGCSVYRVQSKHEDKDFMAHFYPRSYTGLISCWENDWESNIAKALGTLNVIFTPNFIVQITRFYDCNFTTMVEQMRDPFTTKPDWNQFKHELFYWDFLYQSLTALESALLQKCVKGHVDLVYLGDLGFRIRCIRRKSEPGEEENIEILKSFTNLFFALLNGIEDIESRNFSKLFVSVVKFLKCYKEQYKSVCAAWWVSEVAHRIAHEAIEEDDVTNFDFDDLLVPDATELYDHYMWKADVPEENDPSGFLSKDIQVMEHQPYNKRMVTQRNLYLS